MCLESQPEEMKCQTSRPVAAEARAELVVSRSHAVVAVPRDDYKMVLRSILEYGPAKSTEDPVFRFTRP